MEHYARGNVTGENGSKLATLSETGGKDKNGLR